MTTGDYPPLKTKEVKMATFTNQASMTYSGRTVLSNIVSGEIAEPLVITKTALNQAYSVDDPITFVVTITNSGQTPITDLTLTDDLGAYEFGTETLTPLDYTPGAIMMIINGVVQPTPTVTSQDPLTVTGVTVPAGGNTVIVYETAPNSFAPREAGETITNTVSAASVEKAVSITAGETVTVETAAELNVIKTLSPTSVASDSQVTYTFVIENTGNSGAPNDTVLSDTFEPALTGLVVSFNGTTWTEGIEYDYDETTGILTTTAGSITVPAATFTQDPDTGEIVADPGEATLTVTGTL